MRPEESLPRFLTRLTGNLFVVLAWFLAALAASALLPALRILRPASFGVILPLVILAVLAWTLIDFQPGNAARLRALLQKRAYERAFHLAWRWRQMGLLEQLLSAEMALPSELLRPRIRAAYSELRILHESLHDPSNRFVDKDLRLTMQKRSEEARLALWKLCENLEVVASQKVCFADDHPKMQRISNLLDDLTQSTGQVRVKLAELTLAPQQAELEEARMAIDQVRRQSEALLEWEAEC